jgi:transposase
MSNSKSQRLRFGKGDEMLVGIDIAKHKHFARILFTDRSESSPFSFNNNRKGFEELIRWLMFFKRKSNSDSIIVGLESTGHYWEPLAFYLDSVHGIRIVQVNPKHVKKAKEIYDNSPGKTDSKDAGIIAMLIRMGKSQRLVMPRGHFAELRCYSKLREQKVVELGVQRNILHSLVDRVFPEYGSIFKKLESKTSLRILKKYTVPNKIVRAGLKRLSLEIRKASRGQLSGERAEKLINAAKNTVGCKDALDALIFSIRNTVYSIEKIQKEIVIIEKRLEGVFHNIPYAEHLLSIPGIGIISLAIILGEAGDLRRYEVSEELIKLAGLNLFEISSGKHQGKRHITKRGRSLLRKCLFFAALRTVKTNGAFREFYLRLTEKNNMQKTKALVAVSRKILRLLFALVRDGVGYKHQKLQLAA